MIETTTELIVGIAFGLVIGIGPASAVGTLGAVCSDRGSRLPLPASVALGAVLAALNGYFVGVLESGVVRTQLPRLATGTLVVALLSMYATSQGERVASELPFGSGWPIRRGRSLSAEAINSVDAMGQVTIRTTGRIRDIDGYPPLSPDVRTALEADAWRFPADLPLSALETRLETRLRTGTNWLQSPCRSTGEAEQPSPPHRRSAMSRRQCPMAGVPFRFRRSVRPD